MQKKLSLSPRSISKEESFVEISRRRCYPLRSWKNHCEIHLRLARHRHKFLQFLKVWKINIKGGVFGGGWNQLFGPNRLGSSIIVIWPRELVRLIDKLSGEHFDNLSYGHTTPRKVSTGKWSPHPDFLTPQKTWKSAWFINILHSLVRIPY